MTELLNENNRFYKFVFEEIPKSEFSYEVADKLRVLLSFCVKFYVEEYEKGRLSTEQFAKYITETHDDLTEAIAYVEEYFDRKRKASSTSS